MSREINGLVFTVYSVRGQLKIVHCVRSDGRIGRGLVKNVANEAEAWEYAEAYAK